MKQYSFLIILASIVSINSIYAQNKSTMDLLTAYAWVNTDQTYFVKFDKENYYYSNLEKYGYKKSSGSYKYYLSDTNNFVKGYKIDFKENLIGKIHNGIYIITPYRPYWTSKVSSDSLIFVAEALSAPKHVLMPYYGEFPKE